MQIEIFEPSQKKKQLLELLKFDTVMVFLDARNPDVLVPPAFKTQFDLRLNFDYEFEIHDFKVLDEHIEATLAFGEGEFFCRIPFSAVYLIVCQAVSRGCLFPQNVPVEMLGFFFDGNHQNLPQEAKRPFKVISDQPEPEQAVAKKNKRTTKTKTKSTQSEVTQNHVATQDSQPAKKNHLRLVK